VDWTARNPEAAAMSRCGAKLSSADLAGELHRLNRWPPGPRTPDELRVECVSLLGWTGGLVLAMLGQLEAIRLRQHLDKENLPAAPAAAARDRSVR
jgi:hypothetical protein